MSAKIRYLSVFRSYRRQHKFCTAFFLMKPLRRAFFVRHASVGALQGPGCPLPAAHERFVQSDMKKQTPPTCHCEAPKGPWQSREGSHVDRTRHCRGAACRSRRRTYSPYKPPSKWQTLPICHCEEAAGRRGNLAVPGRIVGKLSAKTQLPSRDCHVASLLAMTNLGAIAF